MAGERANGWTGAGVAARISDFAAKHSAQSRFDETPRAHVLWFFLAPDELRILCKRLDHFAQPFFGQRIKLFDANDRRVVDLALSPIIGQVVIDFARAKDEPL